MRKSMVLILAAALSLAASGCATTGDPKAGGLFGWSEPQAQERQRNARAALAKEQKRGQELRAEKARLQKQINAKERELAALKTETQAEGPSPAEAAEISRLEGEIKQLQKETLVLMDL